MELICSPQEKLGCFSKVQILGGSHAGSPSNRRSSSNLSYRTSHLLEANSRILHLLCTTK